MSYLIDTHCHLHDPEFYSEQQQNDALRDLAKRQVGKIICIGTTPEDSATARAFAQSHEGVFWTFGIHPEYAERYSDMVKSGDLHALLADADNQADTGQNATRREHSESVTASAGKASDQAPISRFLVALGEIGLDYHYSPETRDQQIALLEPLLQFALDQNLPVSLHVREAFSDLWPILDNFSGLRGVVHSFTGSKRDLRAALERGFYIGVNGLATYTTVPLPPLENMLLETDAPFLTPVPKRGKMNIPGYVRFVAEYLAGHLGVDVSIIERETTKNAEKLFGLKAKSVRQP